MSALNAQGSIDLYGAGKHLLIVELLDANQNVMVGGGGATFGFSQAGGWLQVAVSQAAAFAPNLFYVTPAGDAERELRHAASDGELRRPSESLRGVRRGLRRDDTVDVSVRFSAWRTPALTVSRST